MPSIKCYDPNDPDSNWSYCPSFGAAIAASVLFAIPTIAHIIQGIHVRKPYTLVLIMGSLWETAGYTARILAVRSQKSSGLATTQQLLILLAPLWINAFAYMVLGRMIHFYLTLDRVLGIRARKVTKMFVRADISSFIVQAAGGVMVTPEASVQTQRTGLHIYMGGVGLQIAFILVFFILAVSFHRIVNQSTMDFIQDGTSPTPNTLPEFRHSAPLPYHLLHTLYFVLSLIIFRNIYRLIEFSLGVESSITRHEWYTYVFDALPMLLAILAFNIYHPNKILRGEKSDFTEENRAMKMEKKQRKEDKKKEKSVKKEAKKISHEDERREKSWSKEMKRMRKEGGAVPLGPV
jgi:hypothetical protein